MYQVCVRCVSQIVCICMCVLLLFSVCACHTSFLHARQLFVESACKAYNVVRKNASLFINLLTMMIRYDVHVRTC
jgi:hypothetical protein